MRVGKSAATCFFIIKENAANRPRVQMPEFFQTLAEVKAASGRFLNYVKQHKKIRVCKTLGLADFGGSAGGLRPLLYGN